MNDQIATQIDTLNSVKDTVTSAITSGDLPELTFSLDNITSDSLIITVLGYTIVFLSLLFLFVTFMNLAKIIKYNTTRKLRAQGKLKEENKTDDSISGEVTAAISMALMLHFREVHDFDNTVITI